MRLFEMLEFLKIREVCKDCFTVDVVGSDTLSFLCFYYMGEWRIYNKLSNTVFACYYGSRCKCLEIINYYYGLPF